MRQKNKKKNLILLSIPFWIILILDQITKALSLDTLRPIITNTLYINSYRDSNMMFGLGNNMVIYTLLLIIAFGFLFLYYRHYQHFTDKNDYIALGIFVGGLLSNYIDRIFRGFKIQFIQLFDLHSFNLADIAIIVGFIMMFFTIIKVSGLYKFNKRATKSVGSLYKASRAKTRKVQ